MDTIVYANHLAPVKSSPDDRMVSQRSIFDQNDDIRHGCSKAKQIKYATRIPGSALPTNYLAKPTAAYYDVVAFYQKDNPAGVAAIVVTIDRTAVYSADQEDMDFIALAAHELRGPITVIRGYLDVIKNDLGNKFTPDDLELFDRLQVSSERLAGYINNILNVSRYDRKQFQVHLHEESLTTIIKGLVPDLALRARTQHRKLIFRIPSDLPTIAADRTSLGEVITNLIDNAIKYSHENGEIITTATVKDEQHGRSYSPR